MGAYPEHYSGIITLCNTYIAVLIILLTHHFRRPKDLLCILIFVVFIIFMAAIAIFGECLHVDDIVRVLSCALLVMLVISLGAGGTPENYLPN